MKQVANATCFFSFENNKLYGYSMKCQLIRIWSNYRHSLSCVAVLFGLLSILFLPHFAFYAALFGRSGCAFYI